MKKISIYLATLLMAISFSALAAHDNGNGNSQHPGGDDDGGGQYHQPSDNSSSSVSDSSAIATSSSNSSASNRSVSGSSASSGGNSVVVTGDSTKEAVNTAAAASGSICVDGTGAQGSGFGISLSRANPVCEQLQMYKIYTAIGNEEKAAEALANAEQLVDIRGFFRGLLTIITLGLL